MKAIDKLYKKQLEEVTQKSSLSFAKDRELDWESILSTIRLRLTEEDEAPFVDLAKALGDSQCKIWNKRAIKTAGRIRLGAMILYAFEEGGFSELKINCISKNRKTVTQYFVKFLRMDKLNQAWLRCKNTKYSRLPSYKPYEPWEAFRHLNGTKLIKTFDKSVNITPESHPIVFEVVNKAQSVGWMINTDILKIEQWAYQNKQPAFNDIWLQAKREAKATKNRETKIIFSMANKLKNRVFFHQYYYDFRGRKYTSTAYLHEQGGDVARGLLLRADSAPIGERGFYWLMVSIASNYAGDAGREDGYKTDKIPLDDRFQWAMDNEEDLLNYGEYPKQFSGWQKADKPFQFLAGCMELVKLRDWQGRLGDFTNYEYESHLEAFIDGSTNGSQHLSALTRDEITAPHVNLVKSQYPGDLYKYVATYVWKEINKRISKMDLNEKIQSVLTMTKMVELSKEIINHTDKEDRKEKIIRYTNFATTNNNENVALRFWEQFKDAKQQRKIIKRGVMTLPYGATQYGLGDQILDDAKKHGIEELNYIHFKWGIYMGKLLYEVCRSHLERPMRLLSIFEAAGKKHDEREQYMRWTVPITGFPVTQYYTQGEVKRVWVKYGPGYMLPNGHCSSEINVSVAHNENPIFMKGKQRSGAAPNIIHSLDAAHLMLIVHNADFNVTTVHDSFGAHLKDMDDLFRITRETFVDLYRNNPLYTIAEEVGADVSDLEIGKLNIRSILESEYAFS